MFWSAVTGRIERANALDPAVEAATTVANKALPPGPVKDALHGRWLGHQLHPLLVALPIGLYSSASLLDVAGGRDSRTAARRLVAAGILASAPTALSGLADWSALGAFTRPRRVGLVHAGANSTSTLLYAASWKARRDGKHARGALLALAGALGLTVGGYLGGHLTYAEGVGVNRNADEQKQPTDWTDVADDADVGEGALTRVEVDGQAILLARRNGRVYALGATCSHYGGPLEQGQLDGSAEPCVVCPWHGSRFRLTDGAVERGPATVPQPGYDVRTVGGRVQVRART